MSLFSFQMTPTKKTENPKQIAMVEGVQRSHIDNNVPALNVIPEYILLPCGCQPSQWEYLAELAIHLEFLRDGYTCLQHDRTFSVADNHKILARSMGQFLLSYKNDMYTHQLRLFTRPSAASTPSNDSESEEEME